MPSRETPSPGGRGRDQQVDIGYGKLGGLEDLDGTQDPCCIPGMDGYPEASAVLWGREGQDSHAYLADQVALVDEILRRSSRLNKPEKMDDTLQPPF